MVGKHKLCYSARMPRFDYMLVQHGTHTGGIHASRPPTITRAAAAVAAAAMSNTPHWPVERARP